MAYIEEFAAKTRNYCSACYGYGVGVRWGCNIPWRLRAWVPGSDCQLSDVDGEPASSVALEKRSRILGPLFSLGANAPNLHLWVVLRGAENIETGDLRSASSSEIEARGRERPAEDSLASEKTSPPLSTPRA